MNILIVFGSRYGSTRDVAERIATVLQRQGHATTVQNAAQPFDLASYAGVVLGSAVYAGRLHRDVLNLARRQRGALAAKRVVGFCVCLAASETSPERRSELEAYLLPLRSLVPLEDSAYFAGAYDPRSVSWITRQVMKLIGATPGDRRDWPAIEAWANQLAAAWS